MSSPTIGYVALLRRNRSFRRLWYGQIASQLGDWLDAIALYILVLHLTGSAEALGGLLVAQFLPSTLVGLGAGVLIDRLSRKWVMIAADLGCAVLVLLFLLVRSAEQVWIIYVATVLKVALTSFFEPAREAAIADLAAPEELVTANAISGLTWSVILAGGAALGGLVAGTLGTDAAFLLDSLSFLLSALFTAGIRIHETHRQERRPASAWQEWREGLSFLRARPRVAVFLASKPLWGLGGGVLVLLTLFGQQVFPEGQSGALSIGFLYAARGLGAGLGPVLAQRWGGSSDRFLRRMLGPGTLLMAVGYLLFGLAPTLTLAAAALVVAHFGGSIQWVFSTTLLQLSVPGRLQGRIFALEMALATLTISLSSYLTGAAFDAGWPARTLALVLAAVFVPPALMLTVLLWRDPSPDGNRS
jgi:MFS family permease